MVGFIPKIIHWCSVKRFQFIYAIGGKVVGARALVIKENEVLLAEHTYLEGWYTLGGLVDRHETPLQAVKREVLEEAGVQVTEEPILLGVYHNTFKKRDDYVFLYVIKSFDLVESYSPEIKECRFFPIDQLPEGVSPSTQRRLQEFLGNVPVADIW